MNNLKEQITEKQIISIETIKETLSTLKYKKLDSFNNTITIIKNNFERELSNPIKINIILDFSHKNRLDISSTYNAFDISKLGSYDDYLTLEFITNQNIKLPEIDNVSFLLYFTKHPKYRNKETYNYKFLIQHTSIDVIKEIILKIIKEIN